MLAYKGFTTITNTGGEIQEPKKNVGRAIVISIAIVTVVYLAVALAVRGNLGSARSPTHAIRARPGRPARVRIGRVQTRRRTRGCCHGDQRDGVDVLDVAMLGMMSDMNEVPEVTAGRRLPFGNPSLVVTTGVAILLTVAFDLSRIAALGAFAYLALDVVIHYGHLRHLRKHTGAKPAPLVAAIIVDTVVFVGFFVYRIRTDWIVIAAFVTFAVLVGGGETIYMRRFSDADGTMKDHEESMS